MKTNWMIFLLLAIVFSPSLLLAEDKAPAAAAASANAAVENSLEGAADDLDDFAFEDEDLIADEDLALDEDLELQEELDAEKV